ncbi:hypothetical protein COW36_11430 [bacterium (Candidatus Blackallbacteria) CG17_big_fil_post_rev_8_21_14_2_50_48_46]|uniref:Uncharacterized protein n=1 Tax=bacterium (Candidatus Blackallbacteria) CG17_big_fil_post_rev_8_21_14_2_50_48_46 TaxID=2014261 RepID=A0A2M7G4P6_9BACT|nr:MAG: hypothetical protein COW64_18525 [bacterium (Candidatus Blackallbacteria) CG18_big_fil_WC_8_21_14_2_50_49_26]PIW16886.1 MAG: hypothetical protein COW36_11430 [bacterium (Candidatus Blackallbacteria) CG17_big_fil_post_rev_8_21_14_2_50_48_46]PIW48083.1 MAG: hypothetical protein COW20_11145 [bacterium (Candidatus Blackallbacteria) CG13_big_fil_rev_8_21_14_2_50_49_14]
MRKIIDKLNKFSTWKFISISFVLFAALKTVFDKIVSPQLKALTGGYDAPDVVFGYNYEYLKNFLLLSKKEGLQYYITHFTSVDLLFPLIGALFLSLALLALLKRIVSEDSKMYYLSLLPFVGMGFDYLENICIVASIFYLPKISNVLLLLVSKISILKLFFGMICLPIISILLVTLLLKKLSARKQNYSLLNQK